jgi:hypothetical protein
VEVLAPTVAQTRSTSVRRDVAQLSQDVVLRSYSLASNL